MSLKQLEQAYLLLNLQHQCLLLEIEQRHEALGEKLMECLRLIHDISLLRRQDDQVQLKQNALALEADRRRSPFNLYDLLCTPLDPNTYPPGFRPRRPHHPTAQALLFRQLGRAFFNDPSLTSSSFNRAWQSVRSHS
jgi:hypothetical protein